MLCSTTDQLWKAPELQSPFNSHTNTVGFPFNGSPKGDVYSFAIIYQEILYRNGVFYLTDDDVEKALNTYNLERSNSRTIGADDTDNENEPLKPHKLSNKEIYSCVKSGLRPSLEFDVCTKEIADLLRKCWSENPTDRPDFTVIKEIIRKTTK